MAKRKVSLISKGKRKLHHLGTGGIAALATSFLVPELIPNESSPEITSTMFLISTVAFPLLRLGYHQKKNIKPASHSLKTCFSGGYGLVFPILYALQSYLPWINQI